MLLVLAVLFHRVLHDHRPESNRPVWPPQSNGHRRHHRHHRLRLHRRLVDDLSSVPVLPLALHCGHVSPHVGCASCVSKLRHQVWDAHRARERRRLQRHYEVFPLIDKDYMWHGLDDE